MPLGLIGEHHAANAAAVAAVALALDVPLDSVVASLATATATSPARMELTERADGVTVLNDAYNANPDSMRPALKSLAAIGRGRPGSRTVAVLGEMLELGASSREEHDAIGRLAVRLDIHQLLVVGQGAKPIHLGACLEGSWGGESVFVPDADAALGWLRENLPAGDVVLFKSSKAAQVRRVADAVLADVNGDEAGRPAQRRPVDEGNPARGRPVPDLHPARDPGRDPGADHQGLRPADPRRRADHAPHQARHPDHGRPGDHPVGGAGLLHRQADHPGPAVLVGAAAAVPARRAGHRRLPRRLHQDRHAAQPRPAQQGQDGRPGHRRGDLRGAGADPSRRPRPDPGVPAPLLHPRLRRLHAAGRRRRAADPGDDLRRQQRGEPHRRPRRPGRPAPRRWCSAPTRW